MPTTVDLPEGFEAMGKPIPFERRQSAYDAIRNDMAPDSTVEEAMSLVNRVADQLERDQPYRAMKEATDAPFGGPPPAGGIHDIIGEGIPHKAMPGLRLDYTGAIRLFAHLLA